MASTASRFYNRNGAAISGNLYNFLEAFGTGNNATTIADFGTSGGAKTIRFNPLATATATTAVPSVGAAAGNMGWRLTAAGINRDVSTDLAVVASGTWTQTLAYTGNRTTGNVTFTVIFYSVVESSGVSTEICRGTNTVLALAAIPTAVSIGQTGVALQALPSGTALQIEIYATSASDLVANNVAIVIERNLAVDTYLDLPTPGLRTRFVRALAVALTLATSATRKSTLNAKSVALSLSTNFARQITSFRAFSVALTLATAISKRVTPIPKTVALTLATAISKAITPIPKSVALSLSTAVSKRVTLLPKSVALTLSTAFSRQITAFRAFTVALTLNTGFGRSLIAARSFSVALALAVKARVDIPVTALNRIAAGGTTVIRKFIQIFDD